MGEKVNPWCHWSNPAWQFDACSPMNNLQPPDIGLENANSHVLPSYLDNYGYICSGIAAPMPFFVGPTADKPLPMTSRAVITLAQSDGLSRVDPAQKRSLVFDHYGNQPCPILGTPFLSKGPLYPVPELQGSNETNVTDVGAHDTEEMHENTEEIDALLDSDSDEGYEKACEFDMVAHSPVENNTWSMESVASFSASASAGAVRPAKKRRLSSNTDMSVIDTANSARPGHFCEQKNAGNDDDAQSCCIGEVQSDDKFALREGEEVEGDCSDDRKRRRERIQHTVTALRKIIPGGIGKDATAVLDEAICYLKYLKLKAKTLGAISL